MAAEEVEGLDSDGLEGVRVGVEGMLRGCLLGGEGVVEGFEPGLRGEEQRCFVSSCHGVYYSFFVLVGKLR